MEAPGIDTCRANGNRTLGSSMIEPEALLPDSPAPSDLAAAPSTLAAIVPLYNEDRTVAELITQLIAQPCIHQIIVDDGSTDQSVSAVKECLAGLPQETADRIALLHHDVSRGIGRPIRTRIDRAIILKRDERATGPFHPTQMRSLPLGIGILHSRFAYESESLRFRELTRETMRPLMVTL